MTRTRSKSPKSAQHSLRSKRIFGVEPHSADNSEIKTVIKERQAALSQLQEHLREGKFVAKWFWVASGKVRFLRLDKVTLQLAQKGIEFVGGKITSKHIG